MERRGSPKLHFTVRSGAAAVVHHVALPRFNLYLQSVLLTFNKNLKHLHIDWVKLLKKCLLA
jgi:hypothetical protein